MITDNRLAIFVALADCGSFTAAARKLSMSQPAVSQNIAALEAESGGPLFTRSTRSVSLNERGRIFYDYAKRILSMYCEMQDALSGATPEQSLLLSLGEGRSARVKVEDGELRIALISSNN